MNRKQSMNDENASGTTPREREHSDPHEQNNPVPRILIILIVLLLLWAIAYILRSPASAGPGVMPGIAISMTDDASIVRSD
ncbi:hypothetical protein ACYX7E_15875 [Luteimonas sp. RIT-PG2_3]